MKITEEQLTAGLTPLVNGNQYKLSPPTEDKKIINYDDIFLSKKKL